MRKKAGKVKKKYRAPNFKEIPYTCVIVNSTGLNNGGSGNGGNGSGGTPVAPFQQE